MDLHLLCGLLNATLCQQIAPQHIQIIGVISGIVLNQCAQYAFHELFQYPAVLDAEQEAVDAQVRIAQHLFFPDPANCTGGFCLEIQRRKRDITDLLLRNAAVNITSF